MFINGHIAHRVLLTDNTHRKTLVGVGYVLIHSRSQYQWDKIIYTYTRYIGHEILVAQRVFKPTELFIWNKYLLRGIYEYQYNMNAPDAVAYAERFFKHAHPISVLKLCIPISKFWFLEFSNILENHIFKSSRFFVPLKDDPIPIRTCIFQIETSFLILRRYIFFLRILMYLSKSKFKRVVFSYITLCYATRMSYSISSLLDKNQWRAVPSIISARCQESFLAPPPPLPNIFYL